MKRRKVVKLGEVTGRCIKGGSVPLSFMESSCNLEPALQRYLSNESVIHHIPHQHGQSFPPTKLVSQIIYSL